ncbi:hypothetical protein IWQ62_005048 [Dispira parvispora]|uniref:Uncharacterized protein n=1 Tax=Dispira parvispora TaxID=1520584 RepID=A0A9W8AQP2_9FUNG|nr:hypothetical protein IWQ62_005048 [Dispira parvispora]
MKVSTLGWGVLAYLLALSPGLQANEDPVCKELWEGLTAEELKSPRGVVAKIVCPSLRIEYTSLNTMNEIKSLNDDDLLSLCSTELRQLGYIIHQKHHMIVSDENNSYKSDRPALYSKYHLSPEVQTNGHPFTDEQYEKFKALPEDLSPIAPIREEWTNRQNLEGFDYSSQHFVRPMTDLPEDNVNRQWIDFDKLSSKELLDFSPILFLSRHNRSVEALVLNEELSSRSENVDFVVAFKRALGVIAETYHMYFASFGDSDWLSENLYIVVNYIFQPNVYIYLLYIRNEEAINNLIDGLSALHTLIDVLPKLETLSQRVPHFKDIVITRPGRNSRLVISWTNSMEYKRGEYHSIGFGAYRRGCDLFKDMVTEFQGPVMRYANVTFDGAKITYDVPTKTT